jgi:MerR family transcriptional regulator, mercuric resistance operon regulatory protein
MPLSNLTIGELSRRTGCAIETIRYYERIQLMPVPPRLGRYRRYTRIDVERIGFIMRARELGFTLNAVRMLLTLTHPGPSCCATVREIASSHLAEMRNRIEHLLRVEETLAGAVRGCESPVDGRCPVIDAIRRAGCPTQPRDGDAVDIARPALSRSPT